MQQPCLVQRTSALVVCLLLTACATPPPNPPSDGGSPVTDGGGMASHDSGEAGDGGISAGDSGVPEVDGGNLELDAGTPVVDGGTPVVDGGTPVVDASTPDADGGTPVVDGGTPVVDASTPDVDGGTPVVDGGSEVVDGGSGCEVAPCQNGGTCMADVPGPTCMCAPGFTGISCERRMVASRIGSWELNPFGVTAAGNAVKLARVAQILNRYDLVAIQGITDTTGTVVPAMLAALNERAGANVYAAVTGSRVGRTTAKQQYAVFYRTSHHQVLTHADYADTADAFDFDPLMVHLRNVASGTEYALIILRTEPVAVRAELDALPAVSAAASVQFGTTHAAIIGDFNADCAYVSDTEFQMLELISGATAGAWQWLSDQSWDTTTVATSDCAYSHLVVSAGLAPQFIPGSAQAYDFATELALDPATATSVANQKPVELSIGF